jgi:predicted SprT family Zn-dependent metalloprotease
MDTMHAQQIATRLIAEHGLTGWRFEFNRSKHALGTCHYQRKTIYLSRPLTEVNSYDETVDTILHEIAHALAGFTAGHGPQWKTVAARIGASPLSSSSNAVSAPAKWLSSCRTPGCTFSSSRHRLSERAKGYACPECCRKHNGGRYDVAYRLVWRENQPTKGR